MFSSVLGLLPFFLGSWLAAAASGVDEPRWGETNKGLQIRIVAVASATDEQVPDFAAATRTKHFKIADEVTLLVQLKNVSDEPVSLQGVRYGEGVSKPWPGKSSQSKFGPLLFSVRVFDEQGVVIESPSADSPDELEMLEVSSGSVEVLAPHESVTMLIKPIQWDASLASFIEAGKYQLELVYHGTSEAAQAQVKKHWPDKPLGNVWVGAAASPRLEIELEKSYRDLRPKLAWGKPNNGLRVAAEYRLSDTRAEDAQEFIDRIFPMGSQVNVRYYIQNTTTEPVEFLSELWRQDDEIMIVTDNGRRSVDHPWYSGIARTKTWMIKPKQIVTVDAIPLSFPPEQDDPTFRSFGAEIKSGPGEYRIFHKLKGFELFTGTSLLTLRKREPRDEPPTYETTLVFRKPDKSIANQGVVQVRIQTGGKQLFDGELAAGSLDLKKWTGEPLSVYARFPGCEENTFYDVNPTKAGRTVIDLTASQPILMQLVDGEGNPVANTSVRFFVRTGEASKNYPFPVKGTEGPVYAKSDRNGNVKLDSVQAGYIYSFYLQPDELAPMLISGIPVGTDLGTIKLVPPFEISGVIKGTPDQLKNFAAEWDQPSEMKLADGSTSFLYAVSKKLTASRDGDQLKFRLTNLRPGKLRIIANFQKGPKSVGHAYARRDVGPTDELFEFELDGPRDDIVIQASAK